MALLIPYKVSLFCTDYIWFSKCNSFEKKASALVPGIHSLKCLMVVRLGIKHILKLERRLINITLYLKLINALTITFALNLIPKHYLNANCLMALPIPYKVSLFCTDYIWLS